MRTWLVALLLDHTDHASVVEMHVPLAWKCLLRMSAKDLRWQWPGIDRGYGMIGRVDSLRMLDALIPPGIRPLDLAEIQTGFYSQAAFRGDTDTIGAVWEMSARNEFAYVDYDVILTNAICYGRLAMVELVKDVIMPSVGLRLNLEYVVENAIEQCEWTLAEVYMRSFSHEARLKMLVAPEHVRDSSAYRWSYVSWRARMHANPTLWEKIQEYLTDDTFVAEEMMTPVLECYKRSMCTIRVY